MEMGEHVKFYLFKQHLLFIFSYKRQTVEQLDDNFFSGQDVIYFDLETNCLIAFDLHLYTISYLFEQDKLYD